MKGDSWSSPDGKIGKQIVSVGEFGSKPTENSQCKVLISDTNTYLKDLSSVTIGQQDGELCRSLDICLVTMYKNEIAQFNVNGTSFRVHLQDFTSEKLICHCTADEKVALALKHKSIGVELFKTSRNKDAAYRFNKALKILHSIPLDVEVPPETVDNILVEELNKLKGTLYNNLASCYFKNESWTLVIDFSKKALLYDSNNVKALYRLAVAYKNDKDFENSFNMFKKLLELDPNNRACSEHLKYVIAQIKKAEENTNIMVKNMFKNSHSTT
ncbi:FK506-binding protein-like [Aethina tumida]|uniref:FK506-binding protein-like n=1 Tax=Aethina tumida TaxID=116153 RepID=UPI00214806A9|nr:FK506-binding protein-like [Aethina tumida]